MAAPNTLQALQRELSKYQSLDPRAVISIAGHEGLSGGIGDGGTSFGPFQLHWGGAYPSWAPHGSSQAANSWAWTPQGIDYALNQIQHVAGGLTGLSAISNISRRFERPADPTSEIADAAHRYGIPYRGGVPVPSGSPAPGIRGAVQTPGALGGGSTNNALIMALVNSVLSSNRARPQMIGG